MKKIQTFKLALAALLLSSSAAFPFVATVSAAAPEAPPVSSAPNWTPTQIDAYAEAAMQRLHIPGLAVGIVRGDRILYAQGYGSAGPGAGPMTAQTPLAIGSTTKSFTALAVMQLVERGEIALDAPVTDYMPEFSLADPARSADITVSDLLHQSSGLSTYDGVAFLSRGTGTLEHHVADLRKVSQTQPAGVGYQYSNLNYNILGAIVERVSGLSYEDYVQRRIFDPLGMHNSFPSPERARTAWTERSGLRPPSGHQFLFGLTVPTRLADHSGTVPSGYLVSTAEDMSKYLLMQMNDGSAGEERLLSAENTELMRQPSADMHDGSFYGMGWVLTGDSAGHNGTTENTYSEMRIRDGYGIFVLANSVDPLVVGYSGLIPGIDDILHGRAPSLDSLPDFVKLYGIADGIVLAIALLFAGSVRSLFRWRKAFRPTGWKIAWNSALLLVCNVAFPLLTLHVLAGLAPWDVALTWAPGIGWGLVLLPWMLFVTGGLKLALMLRAIAGRRRAVPGEAHGTAA
ncbi:serine hydrolase domain-containing protein [Saccharibacillus brassicae]|uniref:Beta-lactamase family protein n=1 Tax=Saccharibacillus brassicae TaxID=2583377 RepID=A0A4Y6UW22_SACBS|nr:serine hydrolase domain-containing protein [Saccharibacillus brassicae]QDH20467.1 beta-lactamase family protein [Saccharibacillus brassicae]